MLERYSQHFGQDSSASASFDGEASLEPEPEPETVCKPATPAVQGELFHNALLFLISVTIKFSFEIFYIYVSVS